MRSLRTACVASTVNKDDNLTVYLVGDILVNQNAVHRRLLVLVGVRNVEGLLETNFGMRRLERFEGIQMEATEFDW